MKKGMVFLGGIFLLSTQILTAQERGVEEADLPRWVEEDVVDFFNDSSTLQFSGRSRIPSTRVVVGNVGALGGPFTIAGTVDGDLVVVNGDLVFEEGGSVTGDVMIVGGRVLGEELGDIGGDLRVFEEPLRYVQRGDRIAAAERRGEGEGDPFSRGYSWGDARLTLKAGQNYNRVEGLPVIFGPSIRTSGRNPLRLDLWGVWRTETGLELGGEDFGYLLRVEKSLGGREELAVGATGFSFVDPIEDWGVSDLEASLATFILHKDLRDYYEREGWSIFARYRLPRLPVEVRAEYFDEEHGFMPIAGPWSLTKNNKPWRNQTLVAEGGFRFVEGTLTIDTRNRRDEPSHGWYIKASGRQGVGGFLNLPAHLASIDPESEIIPAVEYETDFLTGFLDVRNYNRVGPGSSLNLRAILGGTMNDVALPPQFQHAMGGVGSLPGYALFSADCGARAETRFIELTQGDATVVDPISPRYGCDQIALFQAEFRGSLFVDWDFGGGDSGDVWEEDWNWAPRVDLSPDWAAFVNLGRGWTTDGLGNTETLADVGIGLYLGDLGIYYAYPLNEDASGGRDGNFYIRLSRRF